MMPVEEIDNEMMNDIDMEGVSGGAVEANRVRVG